MELHERSLTVSSCNSIERWFESVWVDYAPGGRCGKVLPVTSLGCTGSMLLDIVSNSRYFHLTLPVRYLRAIGDGSAGLEYGSPASVIRAELSLIGVRNHFFRSSL